MGTRKIIARKSRLGQLEKHIFGKIKYLVSHKRKSGQLVLICSRVSSSGTPIDPHPSNYYSNIQHTTYNNHGFCIGLFDIVSC